MQAALLDAGVGTRNPQVAVERWAVHQRVITITLIVHSKQLARAYMVATPVRALDAKTIELVEQDARVTQVTPRIKRLAVDGADALDLEGTVEAGGAECMATWFGGQR